MIDLQIENKSFPGITLCWITVSTGRFLASKFILAWRYFRRHRFWWCNRRQCSYLYGYFILIHRLACEHDDWGYLPSLLFSFRNDRKGTIYIGYHYITDDQIRRLLSAIFNPISPSDAWIIKYVRDRYLQYLPCLFFIVNDQYRFRMAGDCRFSDTGNMFSVSFCSCSITTVPNF